MISLTYCGLLILWETGIINLHSIRLKSYCCNHFSSCALLLIFLSDGRTSDKLPRQQFIDGNTVTNLSSLTKKRVGTLASRFGRCLTVGAIPLGKTATADDFSSLKGIADLARDYESLAFSSSIAVD